MPLTADQVRELASRHESERLDFKRAQYDWNNDGNVELAKDLMAMANVLRPTDPPSYILVGVEEAPDGTGVIVGVPPSDHLDDAKMQEKVKGSLNRHPSFSYTPVEVDGLSVGVLEIRPGGRPFYAPRPKGNRHALRRFEAVVRRGTSSDAASPDEIQAWGREDDPVAHDARRLEVEAQEAQLRVHPHLVANGAAANSKHPDGGDVYSQHFFLENRGEKSFTVHGGRVRLHFTESFATAMSAEPFSVRDPVAAFGEGFAVEFALPESIVVRPHSRPSHVIAAVASAWVYERIERVTGRWYGGYNWEDWVEVRAEYDCVGPTERKAVATARFRIQPVVRFGSPNGSG